MNRQGESGFTAERAERDRERAAATVGLCLECRHVRPVKTNRGSVFYRCGLAETDPSFLRYPPLPVRSCRGYVPAA
jgi:hypothetical protein